MSNDPLPYPPGHPEVVGECINYTGWKNERGYGRRMVDGKRAPAHHFAYREAHGPIPEGMSVDHLCFNPSCVNPEHLRLLTWEENSRYQRAAFKTHCANGHEFTPENTYVRKDGKAWRSCKTCRKAVSDRRTPCTVCGEEVAANTRAKHMRRHHHVEVAA